MAPMSTQPVTAPVGAYNMPEGVGEGTVIPAGWKPTRAAPVPVVRCTVIKKDGERCKRWSLRGLTVCVKHGGQLPNPREHADAVIAAARLRLVNNADMAVDTLEALMEPGTAEGIMLKAATEILDRVGIRGGIEIDVEVTTTDDPVLLINKRLEKLRAAAESQRAREVLALESSDIVDAEVVVDQDTLFEL